MSKVYNKLVRDRIPEIIQADGKKVTTVIVEDDEYYKLLQDKLEEEVAEYIASDSLEELADILEVLQAITKAKGFAWEEVITIAAQKRAERGGFAEKIVLLSVK